MEGSTAKARGLSGMIATSSEANFEAVFWRKIRLLGEPSRGSWLKKKTKKGKLDAA